MASDDDRRGHSQFLAMQWGRTTTARDGGFASTKVKVKYHLPWPVGAPVSVGWWSLAPRVLSAFVCGYTVACFTTAENQPKISQNINSPKKNCGKKLWKKIPEKKLPNLGQKFAKICQNLRKILPEKTPPSSLDQLPGSRVVSRLVSFPC